MVLEASIQKFALLFILDSTDIHCDKVIMKERVYIFLLGFSAGIKVYLITTEIQLGNMNTWKIHTENVSVMGYEV